MKKLVILFLAFTSTAYAGTAFLKAERTSQGSLTKLCIYDYLGSEYAITVQSYQLCPLTIQV